MQPPSPSDPLLLWDPAASDPGQRLIHPLLRGAVLHRDGWACRYCGAEANEVDHVKPRARGGSSTPANLVAACRRCNQAKGLRTPAEWRRAEAMVRLAAELGRRRACRRPRLNRRRDAAAASPGPRPRSGRAGRPGRRP